MIKGRERERERERRGEGKGGGERKGKRGRRDIFCFFGYKRFRL